MNIAQRVGRFIPGLYETLFRFPIPALCALGAAVVTNLDLAKVISLSSEQSLRTVTALAAGFLAGGAVNLSLEAHGRLSRSISHLIATVAAGSIGAICFFDKLTTSDPWFLLPGLVLAVMSAGYIGGKFKEDAFWLFNARFALAIILATAVVCILCGGLTAILASLEYLFEFEVDAVHYRHVWTTGIALFGPVYGLSLMPKRFDEVLLMPSVDSLINRAVSVLLNYILVPLLAIYVVILHFYAGKVLIQWELPKGQVGWMVLMFVLGGTASYLIARPWYDRGTRLTRWFLDWWFVFLTIPIGLLAFGVGRRILDYGVTPERYGLVIVGVWALVMLVYWGVKHRRITNWNIVASLCGLLLASAFGPWGAVGYSISSQVRHFSALLDRNDALTNGKLAISFAGPENLSKEDTASLISIIWFLNDKDAVKRLAPVFEDYSENPFGGDSKGRNPAYALHGIFRPSKPERYATIKHKTTGTISIALAGSGRLTGPHNVYSEIVQPPGNLQHIETFAWRDTKFLMVGSGSRIWRAEILPLLELIKKASEQKQTPQPPIVFDVAGPGGIAQLIIISTNSAIDGGKILRFSMNFWAVLPKE